MALQGPFPVEFGTVFPSGVYAAGGFEKVRDFDRSSGDRVVQQADKATGLPLVPLVDRWSAGKAPDAWLFDAPGHGPLRESNWKRSVGWNAATAAAGLRIPGS